MSGSVEWQALGDGSGGTLYWLSEPADWWDPMTNVRWPGVLRSSVWQSRGRWQWWSGWLGRDEHEYGSGTEDTLTAAQARAIAARSPKVPVR
jgi:hypothetical protein